MSDNQSNNKRTAEVVPSIKPVGGGKKRESNIELLRIVLMFMILFLHANYLAFGTPSIENDGIAGSSFRIFMEVACNVAVNVFVLISGWFGIKFKVKGLMQILYQSFFFSMLALILNFANGNTDSKMIIDEIGVCSAYWFVVSYVGLFILSPVLNAFIDNTGHKQLATTILLFFGYEFVYGLLIEKEAFVRGYSLLSFIGLYLLARYLRLYGNSILKVNRNIFLLLYLALTILQSLVLFGLTYLESPLLLSVQGRLLYYHNPMMIVSAMSLLVYFSKLSFTSKNVNFLAASSFAVYLLHCNNFTIGYYMQYIKMIIGCFDTVSPIVVIFIYTIVVYLIGTLLDQIRIKTWKYINMKIIK